MKLIIKTSNVKEKGKRQYSESSTEEHSSSVNDNFRINANYVNLDSSSAQLQKRRASDHNFGEKFACDILEKERERERE